MRSKVITFGELMMRLSPPSNEKILQTKSLDINFGGAEANTSIMLSNLGVDTAFITALPKNVLGSKAINYLREYGVNTDYIIRSGERIGVYYLEPGISVRRSNVIYDRVGSSIAESNIRDYNFEDIFKDAEWFHFTGITAALGENVLDILKKAIKGARDNKLKISVDLNYRNKLWSYSEFKSVMCDLIKDVDLCIGWIDLESNSEYKSMDIVGSNINYEYFNRVFKQMREQFNIKTIATTLRETLDVSTNALTGIIYSDGILYQSKRYEFSILDRIGAGDAFAGGLIYKLINNENYKDSLEFAVASAVIKHTIKGDSNIVDESEINDLLSGSLKTVKR